MPVATLASRRDARWRVMLPSVAALGLGLYFRCAYLGGPPLGLGEGLRPLSALVTEGAPHPPVYYLLLRFWAALAGDSTVALRASSVLAGLLAILLGYGLAAELTGSQHAATLTATLLAVSPLQVQESQQASPDALGTVMVLASCLALVRALQFDRRRDWACYELSVIVGLYTHLMFIPVVVLHGVSLAAWPRRFPFAMARYWKAATGGFLASLPWAVVMVFPRWAPTAARRPAGWDTLLTAWLEDCLVPAYLAATFLVAWLLARECQSSAIRWRRLLQGATAAVLLCGVIANAARGLVR